MARWRRDHPCDEPVVGRDAVVASWLGEDEPASAEDTGASSRDAPGTLESTDAPDAVDGDTVVAVGTSSYRDVAGGPVVRVHDNCFVMHVDARGRCREFTEDDVERP